MSSVVESAREALGPVGATLPVSFTGTPPVALQREAVGRLERAGYGAAWTNEVIGGKDALVQLGVLLAATERMAFGTCVANIWARAPQIAHGAAALLAQAYPGRFVLGLGVGYPWQAESVGREFGSPLATMRDYVERMDERTAPPALDTAYPRIIGANGPKMLALAGEIADGALPAMVPPRATEETRKLLGPDKLLVTGLPVVVDDDRDRARTIARDTVAGYRGMPSFAARIAGLGFTEREIENLDDRLVDAIVAHGEPAAIADRVAEHRAAGADHVTLMVPIGGDYATGIGHLERVASAFR